MHRRAYLRTSSVAGIGTLAGCTGSLFDDQEAPNDDDQRGADDDGGPAPDATDDGTESDEDHPMTGDAREGWLLSGVTGDSINAFEEWLGRPHAVYGTFVNIGRDEVEGTVESRLGNRWDRGQVPHLWWQPFIPDREGTSDEINIEIAAGEHDDVIEAWAAAIADWAIVDDGPDRRVYLNLAPEMNGDWSPWSPALGDDDEEDFVAMWRHVHDLVHETELAADHVQWIWTLDNTTRGVNRREVYPGDDYVDWAGIHGYNWANWGGWRSAEEVYGSTVEMIRSITDNPIALTEFGTSSETDDGDHDPDKKDAWIADAFAYLRAEEVRMAMWFNITKETDWPVFDGEYGVETIDIDDETYNVYPAYKEAITAEGVLGPDPEEPRLLTDAEFAGVF